MPRPSVEAQRILKTLRHATTSGLHLFRVGLLPGGVDAADEFTQELYLAEARVVEEDRKKGRK